MDERGRIALLARVFASHGSARDVDLAIGDDAAVLRVAGDDHAPPAAAGGGQPAARRLVWTIDEQVEGTHFRVDLLSWRDIGWRSLMAAASDVAAMGAEPWCALSALVLPSNFADRALEELTTGQNEAALAVGAPVVGGNLARGPVLSIATTLLGRCDRAVTRAGAQPGDSLWLAGSLGLAAAGLRALEGNRATDPRTIAAVAAWRTPRALVAEGLAMAEVAGAAIDVSDGLAADAGHVADASGAQLVLEAAALEGDPALAAAASAVGCSALELALYGGEDYALLVAGRVPPPGFRRIGAVQAGRGLLLRTSDGDRALDPRGFDHFAAPPRV